MTKHSPSGSQQIMSERIGSSKMTWSRCGKVCFAVYKIHLDIFPQLVAGNLEEKATQGYLCGRPTEVCRLRRWRKRIRLQMTIWTTRLCMPVHPILKHIIGLARIAVIHDSWYDCFEYYFAILGSNSFPQPQLPQPQPSPPFPNPKKLGSFTGELPGT